MATPAKDGPAPGLQVVRQSGETGPINHKTETTMRYMLAAILLLMASEATAQMTTTTTVITLPDGRTMTCTRTCIFPDRCTVHCD